MSSKMTGNRLYAQGKCKEAIAAYTKEIDLINDSSPKDEEEEEENKLRRSSLYRARSQVQQDLCMVDEALKDATSAIEDDAQSGKAYFRRASVLLDLFQYKEAVVDLNMAEKLEPGLAPYRCEARLRASGEKWVHNCYLKHRLELQHINVHGGVLGSGSNAKSSTGGIKKSAAAADGTIGGGPTASSVLLVGVKQGVEVQYSVPLPRSITKLLNEPTRTGKGNLAPVLQALKLTSRGAMSLLVYGSIDPEGDAAAEKKKKKEEAKKSNVTPATSAEEETDATNGEEEGAAVAEAGTTTPTEEDDDEETKALKKQGQEEMEELFVFLFQQQFQREYGPGVTFGSRTAPSKQEQEEAARNRWSNSDRCPLYLSVVLAEDSFHTPPPADEEAPSSTIGATKEEHGRVFYPGRPRWADDEVDLEAEGQKGLVPDLAETVAWELAHRQRRRLHNRDAKQLEVCATQLREYRAKKEGLCDRTKCNGCGRSIADPDPSECMCGDVYCSMQCHGKHWPQHAKACKIACAEIAEACKWTAWYWELVLMGYYPCKDEVNVVAAWDTQRQEEEEGNGDKTKAELEEEEILFHQELEVEAQRAMNPLGGESTPPPTGDTKKKPKYSALLVILSEAEYTGRLLTRFSTPLKSDTPARLAAKAKLYAHFLQPALALPDEVGGKIRNPSLMSAEDNADWFEVVATNSGNSEDDAWPPLQLAGQPWARSLVHNRVTGLV